MPTNYNLIIRTWLPRPPGIKVMVFLLGSETIISSQRHGLSYCGQLSGEGKNNNNRRLPTACSTVARERIAVLQLNIYSKTLAKKLCTVNNYHIASVRTSLMQARQSPFLLVFLDGKKPLHISQLHTPESQQGGNSTLETPAPSLIPSTVPVPKWGATWF